MPQPPEILRRLIEENGREITRLQERVNETFAVRDEGDAQREAWSRACDELHRRYDELAFPGGYGYVKERLANGERNTVEAALCFLEVRPYFFRSGYMYGDLFRWMKRAPLTEAQRVRFDEVQRRRAAWIERRNAERARERESLLLRWQPPESRHN